MPRDLPPLNALRAFEAAGRHNSFTGAANELNVTHAAISRHVRGLERRLGVQLFKKVSQGVELTEAGAKYLVVVTPALDRIAEATEEISCKSAQSILVSCEPTFAVKWLMPNLGAFEDRYPNVDVRIQSSPKLADIARYECDLAIRFCSTPVRDPNLEVDEIMHTRVHPYGGPAFDEVRTPKQLLELKLFHEDKGALWRRWFAAAGVSDVALPQSANPLGSILAIEGALAGRGVALVADVLVADDIRSGRLKRLSDVGVFYGEYNILYLKEVARRPAVRSFRDWVLEATQNLTDG